MRGLDEHQQRAAAHGDGPAIVLAGPGSGKTKVIVERAVRLIDDGAARPEELLLLTFSRKAATELRQRLADRLRRSYASFPVTTFHGFCHALLDRPPLAKPAERRDAMRAALAAEGNLCLAPSNALIEEALAFAALTDDYLDTPDHPLAAVRRRYDVTDYGALQREAVALLERERPDLPYRYVLVDEYQDTNVAQERLLQLVAPHGNVFVVADEDQSIYGFRGAEIENALGFERRWPGAARYPLPTNYRSAPAIVELGKRVIALNVETHRAKTLAADADRPAELRRRTFRHAAEEADWVAREVARLRLDGVAPGEIAILCRSLRELGPRLAYALRAHGIPFHAPLGGPLHPTADALLSLLELAQEWDDDTAFRTLASPLFGHDPLELRDLGRERALDLGELRRALAIVGRQTSAGNAVYALWEALPYFRELQARVRTDALRDDVDELAAVTALSDAANEFEGPPADFARAFRSGALAADDWLPAGPLPPDAVALLTIHQAKGLEWDAVFVCDLVEGRFPALSRSQYALFERDLFGGRPLDEAAKARRALEEERRLFYVALTRARTHVTLTATEEAREEAGRSLSRFFLEAEPLVAEAPERDGFVSLAEAEAALARARGGGSWQRRAESANAQPMLDGQLWTSASGVAPYENCPLQYYLGSALELIRPSGPNLVLGAVLHDVLEAFHREGPLTRERLHTLAGEHWQAGIRPRALEVEFRRRLERLLENYWQYEVEPGLEGEVLELERPFRVELGDVVLSGRIDRIDRRPDGTLRLLDYKSGRAMSRQEAEDDLQLALYAVACELEPGLAALGRVGELAYLFPKEIAYGRLIRRSQTVTDDLVERTRGRVFELATAIRAERFDFSPQADCMFCDFRRMCPRHVKELPL